MSSSAKVLLATGAGSGLGEAVARRFASEGGRVAILDLDGDRADAVAADLDGSIGIACDVADEEAVAAAVRRTKAELGGIDGVVAAAGYADSGPILDWSLERWNRLIGVHLTGTFLTAKHSIPVLRESGGGAIVNVSSIAATVGQGANGPYGAAKAGISGLTMQLAVELAPQIRVNAIAPGRIRTPMNEEAFKKRGDGDLEEGIRRTLELIPVERIGLPVDIAATVCFLLSDASGFITGQTIVQDGGETLI